MEIQILVMILVASNITFGSRTLTRNNADKNLLLEEKEMKTTNLLNDVLEISKVMGSCIDKIADKIEKLNDSAALTKDAMGEVNVGATDTAEAVQKQLLLTEAIQSKVQLVEDGSGQISESVRSAEQAIQEGKSHIRRLAEQVESSVESGNSKRQEPGKQEKALRSLQQRSLKWQARQRAQQLRSRIC